jgi:Flp pilus assembly pilin Flp
VKRKGKLVNKILRTVKRIFTGKEEGASLAEYGLLLALIAVVCILAIQLLGTQISTLGGSV